MLKPMCTFTANTSRLAVPQCTHAKMCTQEIASVFFSVAKSCWNREHIGISCYMIGFLRVHHSFDWSWFWSFTLQKWNSWSSEPAQFLKKRVEHTTKQRCWLTWIFCKHMSVSSLEQVASGFLKPVQSINNADVSWQIKVNATISFHVMRVL